MDPSVGIAASRAIEPYDWAALLTLIRAEHAYTEGRIDPPSSARNLTVARIARQAETGEVWVVEDHNRPVASVFLTPRGHALSLQMLTVAFTHRGRGLGRHLVDLADGRARRLGLTRLELECRVELVETHAAFAAMGFTITGQKAHPGYDRPTSITMQRPVETT